MKKSLILFLGVILVVGGCAYGPGYGPGYGPVVASGGYAVAIGDRPYYTRGPYYIERGRRYVWIRGHWGRRHGQRFWVPGRYVVR